MLTTKIVTNSPKSIKVLRTFWNNFESEILIFQENKTYFTECLKMELLSYGEYAKILKPDSLIEELKSRYGNALARYLVKI
jgi:predicted DNA-binding transcriptional regulator YafY